MKVSLAKLGVLAAIATAFLLFATVRPGIDTQVAEADLGSPGGITALPSAAPALPGIVNQGIPAIIPARGDGSNAVVAVFCDLFAELPFRMSPESLQCARTEDDMEAGLGGAITFEMEQVYGDGSLASSFAATGSDTLVCRDGAACDLAGGWWDEPGAPDAVVAVEVNGGGENEIITVRGTDEIGESRVVTIVVVDTILAWGPTGAVSTASQEAPAMVSYSCDVVGRRGLTALESCADPGDCADFDADGRAGLDDIFDMLYGIGMDLSVLGNDPFWVQGINVELMQCGGDTGSLFDDFVDFQTDKGIFSVDPFGVTIQQSIYTLLMTFGVIVPPSLDFDCGEGKNIDTFDINSLAVWGTVFELFPFGFTEGACDLDFAGNGVVTTALLGTGEVGVATITAQQGGGVSPPRTINVTFVGEAALSLFIEAPELIGITGGDFTATVVDQDGRPVGGETVECTVEPTGGALAVLPQTGTTGSVASDNPGMVTLTLVPTGASVLAGEELTLTCVLDRDRSVSASETIALTMAPDLETVDLVEGCNPVASTWGDGTAPATIADAVAPADASVNIWKFDPASGTWKGHSSDAPAASDVFTVDTLDAIFVCVDVAATISRPVI